MSWLIPSLAFVAVSGLIGVTTKLALRDLSLFDLFAWATIAYAVAGGVVLATDNPVRLMSPGSIWAIGTGLLASTALIVRFFALKSGEVSRVIPITASYPIVALAIAVLFLGEVLTLARAVGTVMVVGGIAILGQP